MGFIKAIFQKISALHIKQIDLIVEYRFPLNWLQSEQKQYNIIGGIIKLANVCNSMCRYT